MAGAPGQQGTPIVSSWNRARVYCVKQHASKNQIISINLRNVLILIVYFVTTIEYSYVLLFNSSYLPFDLVFPLVDGQLHMGMTKIVQDEVQHGLE